MANIYTTFLNAKGAAFAWIGAWLGPLFAFVGMVEGSTRHLVFGSVMIALPLFSIVSHFRARRSRVPLSDRIVFVIVPAMSLVGGAILAFVLARGQ